MNKKLTLEDLEDYAFYRSGLSADGCLNKLDDYAREAITKYGRTLLKIQKEQILETLSLFENE